MQRIQRYGGYLLLVSIGVCVGQWYGWGLTKATTLTIDNSLLTLQDDRDTRVPAAQPSPIPSPPTRSCADYTPAKLIGLLAQLYAEGGFTRDGALTSSIPLTLGGTGTTTLLTDPTHGPDYLRARAREFLAQADAEERRERFLAEVQWVVKECGKPNN
jgi:hypothetical protein